MDNFIDLTVPEYIDLTLDEPAPIDERAPELHDNWVQLYDDDVAADRRLRAERRDAWDEAFERVHTQLADEWVLQRYGHTHAKQRRLPTTVDRFLREETERRILPLFGVNPYMEENIQRRQRRRL